MASPQMFIQLSIDYFKRNNPVEAVVVNMVQTAYNLITLKSRMKLLKYRFMLERQKLERIETTLTQFSPYETQGSKMDRRY